MTEGVVDRLEAVEVDEQQRQPLAMALGVGRLVLEDLAEQRAVGQLGQVVVHRHLTQLGVLGLHVSEQTLDLLAHAVELVAQLAELVAAVQIEQRPRLAFGDGRRVLLELVDRPHQAPVQHQQQESAAQHHLQADDGADLSAALAHQALGGAVVEADGQGAQHHALAAHRRGHLDDWPVATAFARLQFGGAGALLDQADRADAAVAEELVHGALRGGTVQHPKRVNQRGAGQVQHGAALAFEDGFDTATHQGVGQQQHQQRGNRDADHHRHQDQQAQREPKAHGSVGPCGSGVESLCVKAP